MQGKREKGELGMLYIHRCDTIALTDCYTSLHTESVAAM